jgi:nucleoside-diphosphate-sugar epimerase
MPSEHILVTGATGVVGRSAMQHYAERGYKVTAVSRRRPLNTYGATWHSLDLSDAEACKKLLSPLTDLVQIVFAALHEEPDLAAGWLDQKQIDRNEVMLRCTVEAVAPYAKGLRNVTILQGPKAYGVHVHPIRQGVREDRDEDRNIPNFYWPQEDYLKARQRSQGWSWNVLRPGLVIGMSVGGAMNLYGAIGLYAAVLKGRGEPLYYPGDGLAIAQATDADLIAQACEWILHEPKARNNCYNLDNGEFASLKEYWDVFAEVLGMEPGPEKPFSFRNGLQSFSKEWDQIREKQKLKAPALEEFLGQSGQFSDFIFARGSRPPSSMSCVKIRRDGFNGTTYTDEMIRKFFKMYQDEGLLPSLNKGKTEAKLS